MLKCFIAPAPGEDLRTKMALEVFLQNIGFYKIKLNKVVRNFNDPCLMFVGHERVEHLCGAPLRQALNKEQNALAFLLD